MCVCVWECVWVGVCVGGWVGVLHMWLCRVCFRPRTWQHTPCAAPSRHLYSEAISWRNAAAGETSGAATSGGAMGAMMGSAMGDTTGGTISDEEHAHASTTA